MGKVIIQLIITDTKMIESVCAKKFIKQNMRLVGYRSKLSLLIVFRFAVSFFAIRGIYFKMSTLSITTVFL